ncbi:MAG: hypothetical protein ACLQM6_01755 [Acidobacteriaceae bacterium]
MLWYKGWLETRLRLLFALGIMGFLLFRQNSLAPNIKTSLLMFLVTFYGQILVMLVCALLAGAGIVTQPAFQASKGLHGSMQFTLSLPVSRLRLLVVRAVIGWLETTGAIAAFFYTMWVISPLMRARMMPLALFEYAVTLIVCGSAIYFLSVLLATFLDDQWRIWGTMIAVGALFWLSSHFSLPASIDFVRAAGKNSPLFTHTMPWSAMGFAVVLSAAFFHAALKIAQVREY